MLLCTDRFIKIQTGTLLLTVPEINGRVPGYPVHPFDPYLLWSVTNTTQRSKNKICSKKIYHSLPSFSNVHVHVYTQSADSMLFRSFWTHQRSTEKMRPNLIAMEIKISNQARTYPARVLKLTSQWALHNANSKGTTPRKSAQLLQEQERNTQSADSMLFRSFWTRAVHVYMYMTYILFCFHWTQELRKAERMQMQYGSSSNEARPFTAVTHRSQEYLQQMRSELVVLRSRVNLLSRKEKRIQVSVVFLYSVIAAVFISGIHAAVCAVAYHHE